jgi:Flp pilus assembly pilin Flp
MLKYYVEAVKRLSTDKDGVVSLEYVVVAAVVVTVVIAVYGSGANGALGGAINSGFTAITTAMVGL